MWYYQVWPEGQPHKAKKARSQRHAAWIAWWMGMAQVFRLHKARRIVTCKTQYGYTDPVILDGMHP